MPKQRANGPLGPACCRAAKTVPSRLPLISLGIFCSAAGCRRPPGRPLPITSKFYAASMLRAAGADGGRFLRLRLPGGCGATETAGAKSPLREFRSLAPVGGDEDLLQHLPLHRLLHDRHIAEPAVDALDAIAGYENERNFPRHQHVGDRVDEFSAEI